MEREMKNYKELAKRIEEMLHLETQVVAYKHLGSLDEFNKIPDVRTFNHFFTFCQLVTMARVNGWTVGATKADAREGRLLDRCSRIHGLRIASEKSMAAEAASFTTTWFSSFEDGVKQQKDYPRIPAGEGIVLAPLFTASFDPDVVLLYGLPAQVMLVMCGLQKERYERFQFFFIGEGACADSLAQCYISRKPALAIPCYGERSLGGVVDGEIVIALPPKELERAVSGLEKLCSIGLGYPIRRRVAEMDLSGALGERYPETKKTTSR
jgi:uncharacterized protein (DUF169 family)